MNTRREYFFGSLAAIYDMFTPEQIGCSLQTLWYEGKLAVGGAPFATGRCLVSKEPVYRKKQATSNKRTIKKQ